MKRTRSLWPTVLLLWRRAPRAGAPAYRCIGRRPLLGLAVSSSSMYIVAIAEMHWKHAAYFFSKKRSIFQIKLVHTESWTLLDFKINFTSLQINWALAFSATAQHLLTLDSRSCLCKQIWTVILLHKCMFCPLASAYTASISYSGDWHRSIVLLHPLGSSAAV